MTTVSVQSAWLGDPGERWKGAGTGLICPKSARSSSLLYMALLGAGFSAVKVPANAPDNPKDLTDLVSAGCVCGAGGGGAEIAPCHAQCSRGPQGHKHTQHPSSTQSSSG